jgi:hypothetical protein
MLEARAANLASVRAKRAPWEHVITVGTPPTKLAVGSFLPYGPNQLKDLVAAINAASPCNTSAQPRLFLAGGGRKKFKDTEGVDTKVVRRVTLRCHCYGKPSVKKEKEDMGEATVAKASRKTSSQKCECPAQIVFDWDRPDSLHASVRHMDLQHANHPDPRLLGVEAFAAWIDSVSAHFLTPVHLHLLTPAIAYTYPIYSYDAFCPSRRHKKP